ncbi:MAG: hypothetical protein KA515_00460 [Candidatus Pacebacteria bacterium]|nr:hypothetical protein [Candidatus Paceibacterota bacterium]
MTKGVERAWVHALDDLRSFSEGPLEKEISNVRRAIYDPKKDRTVVTGDAISFAEALARLISLGFV